VVKLYIYTGFCLKVACVITIPFPYRNPVFDLVGKKMDFLAIYSNKIENNRKWSVPELGHNHVFLKPFWIKYKQERFLHLNPDVWPTLTRFNPEIVILYGYSPTQQIAFLWAKLFKRKIVLYNDSWEINERIVGPRQRWIRKQFTNNAHAFIAASNKTAKLYRQYGADPAKTVVSPFAISNKYFYVVFRSSHCIE
jgi:hypothetical protein